MTGIKNTSFDRSRSILSRAKRDWPFASPSPLALLAGCQATPNAELRGTGDFGVVVAHLEPGEAVLHMEFTPRGEQVWISARDSDRVVVYDTRTLEEVARLPSESPSGIFFTDRAHRIGL